MGDERVQLLVLTKGRRLRRAFGEQDKSKGTDAMFTTKRYGSYKLDAEASFPHPWGFPWLMKQGPTWFVVEGIPQSMPLNGVKLGRIDDGTFKAAIRSRIVQEIVQATVLTQKFETFLYVTMAAACAAVAIGLLVFFEVAGAKEAALEAMYAANAAAQAAAAQPPTFPPAVPGPIEVVP